jgi:hypothetical protein
MRKVIFIFAILLLALTSDAQYRIMGYYPNTAYGDYVIVYGYYDSSGIFRLSHCRTNAIGPAIFSGLNYLDINTCEVKTRTVVETPTAPVIPPPPTPKLEKAFY